MAYDRVAAVEYARQWAFSRNPRFYDFEELGGDCTNFVSQCVYAGAGVMNYTPEFGWYYVSLNMRTPSWTGVQFFYNFMTTNSGDGPYGYEAPISEAQIGDVIQFAFNDSPNFTHTLLVVRTGRNPNPRNILLSTHSYDAFNRPMDSYTYTNARLIHIDGVRGQ